MLILWQTVLDHLTSAAIGGVTAFVMFVIMLPTKLGERLIGHHFDARLEAMKHDQGKELRKLQAELDHFKDRGTRSNEREYQALAAVWENFVESFYETTAAVLQFSDIPDFQGNDGGGHNRYAGQRGFLQAAD